jgi:hypothetical protein
VDASGEQALARAKRYEGFRVQKSSDAVNIKQTDDVI